MSEVGEAVSETVQQHAPESRMNSAVAALVAIAATFMAICNIKDGNIVQGMGQAQARSVDAWSYYQAKSGKEVLCRNTAALLRAVRAPADQISRTDTHADRYAGEKDAIKRDPEGYEKQYDALNVHDDQFDMTEACLSLSIALLGITALTRKRWLLVFASALMGIGCALGLSGFLGWSFHPGWLARLLG